MESKTVLNENSSGNFKLHAFIVQKELHSLIGTVKKMQLVTTYEEVLAGLKDYIWKKKLYDPCNPFKVCCKDDELGSVIGVKEFTVFNVNTLLHKLLIPLSKTNKDSPEVTLQSVSDNSSKRKSDGNTESEQKKMCAVDAPLQSDISENCETEQKKMSADAAASFQCGSPMILHIPPSPAKCNDLSDSCDSLQGYETAYVKDSTDEIPSVVDSDDFFSPGDRILAIEETYNLEYEVESDSSDDVQSNSSVTSSEADITAEVSLDAYILSLVCRTDSDIEFFADDSSDEDIEIPESDHWKCSKCNFSNRPTMRYCLRCWKERLEWWPETSQSEELISPRRKRQKQQRKSKKFLSGSSTENTEKDEASFSKSSQESQASTCSSEVSQENKETLELPTNFKLSSVSEPESKLCIICCDKTRNASIIHGKFAHQISCYRCARTLQKRKKRCPLCRRTIERVVYQLSNV